MLRGLLGGADDGKWRGNAAEAGRGDAIPPMRARDLRIVNNNTREFQGGWTIETSDGRIVAGPYIAHIDAKQAKADLVAGRRPRGAG